MEEMWPAFLKHKRRNTSVHLYRQLKYWKSGGFCSSSVPLQMLVGPFFFFFSPHTTRNMCHHFILDNMIWGRNVKKFAHLLHPIRVGFDHTPVGNPPRYELPPTQYNASAHLRHRTPRWAYWIEFKYCIKFWLKPNTRLGLLVSSS